MSAGDGGPGDREIAIRVFAAEYDDADLSYSESDEERAPNYVVTPTGARVNRLFVVGVLTEVEPVNEEMLRARVVDPTGPFVVYAGQYQPDALAFLERAEPPAFVAVTGKARTFEPEDADRVYTSVRPESISAVDAETRDRWVVQTAEQTLDRVQTMAGAVASDARGEELEVALREQDVAPGLAAGIPRAINHYGTTPTYLAAVRDLAVGALRVVAGDQDEVTGLNVAPDDPGDVTATDLADGAVTASAAAAESSDAVASTGSLTEEPPEPDGAAEPAEAADTFGETEPTDTANTSAGDSTAETGADATPSSDRASPAVADETTTTEAESKEQTGDETVETETSTASTGSLTEEPPEPDGAAEPAEAAGPTAETDTNDELGDFDGEFEIDEDERQEIEEEYGTDFSTGSEVEEPGEAGIEPEAPQSADMESTASATESAETEPQTGSTETDAPDTETADTEGESAEEAVPTEDVDLERAVLEVMDDLDDGEGAERDAVVSAVADRYGADPDAVEETIQDALMSGQCYEPEEDQLKAI